MRPSGRARRAVQIFYSLEEIRRLLALSRRARPLSVKPVLRAAMLHTDRRAGIARRLPPAGARRSDFFVFRFSDGQELDSEDAIGHWESARFLLDRVQPGKGDIGPNPAATTGCAAGTGPRSLYMLARDAAPSGRRGPGGSRSSGGSRTRFLRGAIHETLASPAVQEALRGRSADITLGVGSPRRRAQAAEDLLRRAVKTEARRRRGAAAPRPRARRARSAQGRRAELSQAGVAQNKPLLILRPVSAAPPRHSAMAAARAAFVGGVQQPAGRPVAAARPEPARPQPRQPGEAASSAGPCLRACATATQATTRGGRMQLSAGRFFPVSKANVVDTLRARRCRSEPGAAGVAVRGAARGGARARDDRAAADFSSRLEAVRVDVLVTDNGGRSRAGPRRISSSSTTACRRRRSRELRDVARRRDPGVRPKRERHRRSAGAAAGRGPCGARCADAARSGRARHLQPSRGTAAAADSRQPAGRGRGGGGGAHGETSLFDGVYAGTAGRGA